MANDATTTRMSAAFDRNIRAGVIPKQNRDWEGGFFVEKGANYEKTIINLLKNAKNSQGVSSPLINENFSPAGTTLNPDIAFWIYLDKKTNKTSFATVEVKTSLSANLFTRKLSVKSTTRKNEKKWDITSSSGNSRTSKTHDLLVEIYKTYEKKILNAIENVFDLPIDNSSKKRSPFYTIDDVYTSFVDNTFTSKFNKYVNKTSKNIYTGIEVVDLYKKYLNNLNTYYIQIKDKGLYYVGEDKYKLNSKLPANKEIKEFSLRTASVNLKKAYKGNNKYELQLQVTSSARTIPNSNFSLDNLDDLQIWADILYR